MTMTVVIILVPRSTVYTALTRGSIQIDSVKLPQIPGCQSSPILTLQREKVRHREARRVTTGHTQLVSGTMGLEVCILTPEPSCSPPSTVRQLQLSGVLVPGVPREAAVTSHHVEIKVWRTFMTCQCHKDLTLSLPGF
jgi:hypothetical protein